MILAPVTPRPPRPAGSVGATTVTAIREDPLGFLESAAARFPDRWWHEADGRRVHQLNHPDLVRHVLREHYERYTKSGTPDDAMLTPLLGKGLLTSDGDVWARQRRLAAPSFRPSEIERFDTLMTRCAGDLADGWARAAAEDRPVRVDHDLTGLTLRIVVAALLGPDLPGVGPGFGQAVDEVNRFIGHVDPAASDPDAPARRAGFVLAKRFLDQVVTMLIAGRRWSLAAGEAPTDLVSALLTGGHGDGEAFTETELHDQVLTMIMAGHETTAKALSWTLHLLAAHPEAEAAVHDELARVLGGRVPTAADLPDLPMTRAIIDESIRLYPPIWLLSRSTAADDVIGGEPVPAGTLICISPWLLHRHPGFWAEPGRFLPERFLPGAAPDRPSHLYLPFGGGPRTCLGQAFALTEAVLVLATVLPRLRLTAQPGHPVEPEALVTLRPRHGLLMRVQVRRG